MLMQNARKNGICEDGYNEMRQCKTIGELLEYYKETIDWSLELNYPTLQDIRDLFNVEELAEHGIFIDRTFDGEVLSSHQSYVFHNCKGYVNVGMDYDNAVIPMLYFANGCEMYVRCQQRNVVSIKVPLYVFGENNVTATDSENATFTFYRKEVRYER